jgi:4-alpha-glucanotransferase
VYTGTHDSDTTLGWWTNADDQTKKSIRRHFTSENQALVWDLIENAFASNSMIAIIPAQDLLGLGSKARMNTPGTTNGNWAWRMAQRDELLNFRMRVRGLLEEHRPYKTK